MKKLLTILLAVVLVLSLSISAYAADEVEIPLDADHVGEGCASVEELTIADGSITGNEIGIFALNLPDIVPIDQTVVVHIIGSSDGDFRAWLLATEAGGDKANQATFSNQWKASENGFVAPGEFEKFIELTAEDFDSQGATSANRVAFKAPSWDSTLQNLKLTYVGVIYGGMADVEADAVADAQPFADASAEALAAANAANGDKDALNAALADAEAAVEALTERSELGFPGVTAMLNDAKSVVRDINAMINAADAEAVLESIQGDVEAVNNALTAAQGAGKDLEALKAALSDAKAAAANIQTVADSGNYSDVNAAAKDAAATVTEIEKLIKDAEEQIKLDEAAAAEEAARKQKATTTTIIVIAVVVVVIIVAVVAVMLAKKKKK